MDYSELKTKHSQKDIKSLDQDGIRFAKNNLVPSYQKSMLVIFGFLYLLLLAFAILLTFATIRLLFVRGFAYVNDNLLLASFGPFLLFMSIMIVVAYIYERRVKLLHIYSFYMFARNNKLNYVYKSKLEDILDKSEVYLPSSGLIYGSGRKKKFSDLVGNSKFSLGNYRYLTGYGRSTEEHLWVVGSIKLSRNLPHIVLDAKSNNNLGFSNLPESFKRNQITNAEPALIDNFNLYAPLGYKIDSLSFIAPDFIEVLVKNLSDFDVEIIDDTLYIYHMDYIDKESYESLLTKLHLIAQSLEDNIDTYIDSRLNPTNEIKGLTSISPEGQRLVVNNRGKIIATVAFSVYALYVLIQIIRSALNFW